MRFHRPIQKDRWAVFVSGRGSNLQSILDQDFNSKIKLVLSDKPEAAALKKAKKFGVPILVLSKPLDWVQIHHELKQRQITNIFLLGFMRILPESFINLWTGRIFNIHPSLLPLYPGKDSFQKSFNDQSDVGCTLHEVNAVVDGGRKIFQKKVISAAEIKKRSLSLSEAQIYLTLNEQRLVKEAFGCL